MKVKVLKSFVHDGWFMEQTLTVEIEDEAAKKYEKEGLVQRVKKEPKKTK